MGTDQTPGEARITAPLAGRSIIRAPFVQDMRTRLSAHCAPAWDAQARVWTVPRSSLGPAIAVLRNAFGDVTVSIEVERDDADRDGIERAGRGSDWLIYRLSAADGDDDRLPDSLAPRLTIRPRPHQRAATR